MTIFALFGLGLKNKSMALKIGLLRQFFGKSTSLHLPRVLSRMASAVQPRFLTAMVLVG